MIGVIVEGPREIRTRWWEWLGLVFTGAFVFSLGMRSGPPPPRPGVAATPQLVDDVFLVSMVAMAVLGSRTGFALRNRRQSVVGRLVGSAWAAMPVLALLVHVLPHPTWRQYVAAMAAFGAATFLGADLRESHDDRIEKRRLLRESRDEALRLKLAPHFLFNALNTVKAQLGSDPQGAASTVDRLAGLLRQVLDTSGRLTVPLREELAFVEAYLGIERLRLGDRIRVELEIAEGVEAVEIPPLSLQALVENAVKHGVAPREEGGEIRIWARIEPWRNREKVWFGVESPLSTGAEPGPRVGLEALRARLRDPTDLVTEIRGRRFLAEFACYRDEWIAPRG